MTLRPRSVTYPRMIAVLALWLALPVGAQNLFLTPRRQILRPCETYLDADDSTYRRGLLRRFGNYTLVDGETFGDHELRIDDGTFTPLEFTLPDLFHGEASWRREHWGVDPEFAGPTFWFYDAGFRNLREDSERMNAVVSAPMLRTNASSLSFRSTPTRVRDLERLNTFRWACHDRVMRRYRDHEGKQKYLGDLDFEQFREADRKNLNVDVFGVANRYLGWDANRKTIRDALISSIQISYDEPRDYLRPTLDGLLAANGEAPTEPRRLPFMERLDPEHRDAFVEGFWRSFGGSSVCEVTRYVNNRTPEVIVNRLLYEVYRHVRLRKCQVMVASGDPFTLRLFRRYGFERDRRLPTSGSMNESLAVLRVNSPVFFEVFDRLRQRSLVDAPVRIE